MSHYLVVAGILFVAGGIYLRYRLLVWGENRRDRKAGVETLFDGRK